MERPTQQEWRAEFDASVTFSNGGGLDAHGFRLDIPDRDISESELGALFVQHLGLLMVDEVQIRNKTVFEERHKGSRGVERRAERRRIVDLSHTIQDGMVTYPGLPGPEITDFLTHEASRPRYADDTEFHIGRISLVGNTSTYLDSPFHRFRDGHDLSELELGRIGDLDGVVVRVTGSATRVVDKAAFVPHDVEDKAVLVHTGWDKHWHTKRYGVDAPFLTEDAADWLVEQNVALVGIDSVNIDDVGDPRRPVHTALLRAGIPVVEHLTRLDELPPSGFRFHAAPPRVAGMSAFPVRAYAVIG